MFLLQDEQANSFPDLAVAVLRIRTISDVLFDALPVTALIHLRGTCSAMRAAVQAYLTSTRRSFELDLSAMETSQAHEEITAWDIFLRVRVRAQMTTRLRISGTLDDVVGMDHTVTERFQRVILDRLRTRPRVVVESVDSLVALVVGSGHTSYAREQMREVLDNSAPHIQTIGSWLDAQLLPQRRLQQLSQANLTRYRRDEQPVDAYVRGLVRLVNNLTRHSSGHLRVTIQVNIHAAEVREMIPERLADGSCVAVRSLAEDGRWSFIHITRGDAA